MQIEKRKNPRFDLGITVIHDGKRRMTKDISVEGAFIEKDEWDKDMTLLAIGSDISLSFDFPTAEDYIDVTGVVKHHGNEDGMGIWFKEIDKGDKDFIRGFISDYL